jgi:hypothetical protein
LNAARVHHGLQPLQPDPRRRSQCRTACHLGREISQRSLARIDRIGHHPSKSAAW